MTETAHANTREVEAKFELEPAARETLLRLDSVGRFVVASRREIPQDDIYFDTEDGRLAAHGATLRVRRSAAGAVMTFKGRRAATTGEDAHIASRLEVEAALDPEDAASVSDSRPLSAGTGAAPLALARELAGERQLVPVARLENERVTLLLNADDGPRVEMAIDRCRGTRYADGRVVRFDEVELEARDAGQEVLRELSDALREAAPGLRPSALTKLGRTLD